MNAVEQLESEIEDISILISASEQWAQIYHDHPKQHTDLLKAEAKLERMMRSYFRSLATMRVRNYINWSRYQYDVIMADDDDPIVDVDLFDDTEDTIAIQIVYDALLAGIIAGATVAEIQAGFQTGVSASTPYILKAAREEAGQLIKQINQTTLNQIRESIQTSLALHKNQTEAISDIQDIINNPVRAQMIARTEAVRAWNKGMFDFAIQNGAQTITWQAFPDACAICTANDGKTIAVGDKFGGSGKGEVQYPPAHVNCRCGVKYGY